MALRFLVWSFCFALHSTVIQSLSWPTVGGCVCEHWVCYIYAHTVHSCSHFQIIKPERERKYTSILKSAMIVWLAVKKERETWIKLKMKLTNDEPWRSRSKPPTTYNNVCMHINARILRIVLNIMPCMKSGDRWFRSCGSDLFFIRSKEHRAIVYNHPVRVKHILYEHISLLWLHCLRFSFFDSN